MSRRRFSVNDLVPSQSESVAKGNISRLRDSADISPPGQLARLARSDLGLGLFTVKRQRLTRRGIALSCRRKR